MVEEIKKEECTCGEECSCNKEESKPEVSQVKAYPAKDPNNNLIAVFEQEMECKGCGKKWTHQLIVGVGTIFQFANIFDQAIKKVMAENQSSIITPGGNKTNSGIIIPGK